MGFRASLKLYFGLGISVRAKGVGLHANRTGQDSTSQCQPFAWKS